MRAELAAFPDGDYSFEDVIENDGIEDRALHDRGRRATSRATRWWSTTAGTSPQAQGPINATLGVAWSATYNAHPAPDRPVDPEELRLLPADQGGRAAGQRGQRRLSRRRSVGGNTETHPRLANIVIGAHGAGACPTRAMASEGCTGTQLRLRRRRIPTTTNTSPATTSMSGGWGGRGSPTATTRQLASTAIAASMPTEVFETRYPWLVEELELVPDSGGAGRVSRRPRRRASAALPRRRSPSAR